MINLVLFLKLLVTTCIFRSVATRWSTQLLPKIVLETDAHFASFLREEEVRDR